MKEQKRGFSQAEEKYMNRKVKTKGDLCKKIITLDF